MKSRTRFLLCTLIMLCFIASNAQLQQHNYLGKINELRKSLLHAADISRKSKAPAIITHPFTKNISLSLSINSNKRDGNWDYFYGVVNHINESRFYIKISETSVSGAIESIEQKKIYQYYSDVNGSVFLKETPIDSVLCFGYTTEKVQDLKQPHSTARVSVPPLQSLENAAAVLYLDFDGQTVTNTYWNQMYNSGQPIIVSPSSFTDDEIIEIWKLVSEDYRPFNLNVTTSETVFNQAASNKRMRVIFTPTKSWYPVSVGGVAQIGSFTWGGTANGETPCWVWTTSAKSAGEAASHEAGHTMNLYHDGRTSPAEDRFEGQANWAPIMGLGYYKPVVQWSKGEYALSNNTSDDVQTIATYTGSGFRTDDHSNSSSNATPLKVESNGAILGEKNKGVISKRDDVDVFSFTSSGQQTGFTVQPDTVHPNLDIILTVRSSGGMIMASSDPATMEASITVTLPAGTYYLFIDGGTGTSGANSDYGSLGAYSISSKTYCRPSQMINCSIQPLFINGVGLNTLQNMNSGCSIAGNGYTNYDPSGLLTTTVKRGETVSLNITGSNQTEQFFGAWIDFNADKDFEDAGELVFASTAASLNVTTSIVIPNTATQGPARMRIRSKYGDRVTVNDYCSVLQFGETEDYTITVGEGASAPVKIKDFTAIANGCNVNLTWQSDVINAPFFTIERSINGIDFSEAGRAAIRNDKLYNFTEAMNVPGIYYYRIRLTENNGTTAYSNIVTVDLNCSAEKKIKVNPTLTTGLIGITLYDGLQNAEVRIINSLGIVVLTDNTKNLLRSFRLKNLPNGMYIVQTVNDGKPVDNTRIFLLQ